MASGIGEPGRACSQNRAAGVPAAAGRPCAPARPVAAHIKMRRSAHGCMAA